MKVFLGGTCNDSKWREELIPMLEEMGIEFFNPVVDDWNVESMAEEERQKLICDVSLYLITPEMKGVYSIAEVVQSSFLKPKQTVFCVLREYGGKVFDDVEWKSMKGVCRILKENGVDTMSSLYTTALYLKANIYH
jgi:hypothetical protein